MKRIKNLISFIYPLTIEIRSGSVTPYLEVIRSGGKYVLNSQNANYSFGGIHLIFDDLFRHIEIGKYSIKNVLLLGMGAGNAISLLRQYGINCAVTAIEKDEVVIELAKKYFNIETYSSLKIVNKDAFAYAAQTSEKYDLIISDLFIDGNVPEIFASIDYLQNLKRISNEQSCIIYNKMTELPVHKRELAGLSQNFEHVFPGSEVLKFYAYEAENSLLYCNTLPQISRNTGLQAQEIMKPVLKPA
jgi:hypothetical protein